jgi:hypothetical protein
VTGFFLVIRHRTRHATPDLFIFVDERTRLRGISRCPAVLSFTMPPGIERFCGGGMVRR